MNPEKILLSMHFGMPNEYFSTRNNPFVHPVLSSPVVEQELVGGRESAEDQMKLSSKLVDALWRSYNAMKMEAPTQAPYACSLIASMYVKSAGHWKERT